MERVNINVSTYILLRAKAGLTDVHVRIIDVSDGSELLAWALMTEVEAGFYRYPYTFTSTGTYEAQYKSDAEHLFTSKVYEVVGAVSTYETGLQADVERYLLLRAKGGLTDVHVRIIDVSDGSELLAWALMTEVEAGFYRYPYTFTDSGTYEAQYKSDSTRFFTSKIYTVVDVTVYCSPADVARVMNLMVSGARLVFSNTSTPTLEEVNSMIEEATDYIDKETGHSWRETTVTDEYYDYIPPRGWGRWSRRNIDNRIIHLHHRKIRSFTSGTHKIEVWDGEWTDLIAGYTEGRDEDYWIDYGLGVVYFITKHPTKRKNAVRVTYRYGDTTIPKDIRNLCAKIVAMELITTSDYNNLVPEGAEGLLSKKIEYFEKDIKEKLEQHKEIFILV